jgi:hypothetical protein
MDSELRREARGEPHGKVCDLAPRAVTQGKEKLVLEGIDMRLEHSLLLGGVRRR